MTKHTNSTTELVINCQIIRRQQLGISKVICCTDITIKTKGSKNRHFPFHFHSMPLELNTSSLTDSKVRLFLASDYTHPEKGLNVKLGWDDIITYVRIENIQTQVFLKSAQDSAAAMIW